MFHLNTRTVGDVPHRLFRIQYQRYQFDTYFTRVLKLYVTHRIASFHAKLECQSPLDGIALLSCYLHIFEE